MTKIWKRTKKVHTCIIFATINSEFWIGFLLTTMLFCIISDTKLSLQHFLSTNFTIQDKYLNKHSTLLHQLNRNISHMEIETTKNVKIQNQRNTTQLSYAPQFAVNLTHFMLIPIRKMWQNYHHSAITEDIYSTRYTIAFITHKDN